MNQLPETIHALKGTRPTRAIVPDAEPLAPGRPKYPKGISAEAKAVYKRLCKLLGDRRALTEGDSELLRLYAILFDRHAKAIAKLAQEGEICTYTRLDSSGAAHDVEKPNLWLKVAETSEKNMVACLDRLGLTPLNRAKVKPTKSEKPEAPIDPMVELMNRPREPHQPVPVVICAPVTDVTIHTEKINDDDIGFDA